MKNLQGWMILGIACLAGCVGTTIPVQAQQGYRHRREGAVGGACGRSLDN